MIRVKVKSEKVEKALDRLAREAADFAPALKEIGEMLVASTKQRFERKEAPDGMPWAPLSPVTIARKGNDNILIGETGDLSDQIAYAISGHVLEVGSSMVYASTHQFGARKGEYGKTRRGAPIPWGDIPARPFLGISREDEADIEAIIAEHIRRSLNG